MVSRRMGGSSTSRTVTVMLRKVSAPSKPKMKARTSSRKDDRHSVLRASGCATLTWPEQKSTEKETAPPTYGSSGNWRVMRYWTG